MDFMASEASFDEKDAYLRMVIALSFSDSMIILVLLSLVSGDTSFR